MIIALLLLIGIGIWTVYITTKTEVQADQLVTNRVGERLTRLWEDAFKSLKENKFLRAERALLTILKFDERNAGAYNRLGILYAKQRSFDHAQECFEIAQSLEPNASTLHNLGLIYYETGEYQKAAHVFEEALKDETEVPTRYIAYAKVQEKLSNERKMVESLEKAAKLLPNRQTYTLVAEAYRKTGREDDAKKIEGALKRASQKLRRAPRIKQPRKVVM
jgi:tetratricopeptide (TPR) repeat protein